MGKHTPAPWLIRNDPHEAGRVFIETPDESIIAVLGNGDLFEKRFDNARVIAAAPKMIDELAALRSLLSDALKALEPMAKTGNNIHPDFNRDTAYFELPVLGVQLRIAAELHARIKEVMNSQ